jgi:endonuclease/exonuclease/phosphatase family metal-dependent hydrolase
LTFVVGVCVRRLLVPLGVLLFIDLLRVWLPSIITIFGQAASTPAELLGAFALVWFLVAFLAPVLARIAGAARVGVVAALVLAGCRLALVVTGGQAQLYVASVGLLAGLCWLVTLAVRGASPRPVAYGLAAAAVEHAAVGTFDLTWRGMWAIVLVGAFVAGFALLVFVGEPEFGDGSWFAVGPVLFVALQVALSPALVATGVSYVAGRADGVAVGAGPVAAAAEVVLVTAAVLGFGYLVASPPTATWARALCAGGLVLGAVAFGFAPGWTYVVVVPATAAALGGCAGIAFAGRRGSVPGEVSPRQGFLCAAGMLAFAVAVFAYYASYDLGYPNRWVPPLVAAVVAVVALRRAGSAVARDLPTVDARLRRAVPVAVLALVSLGVWWAPPGTHPAPRPNELRLVAYNIRMGFGLDGRFSIAELARVIRAERPDVVLLSEVDRGWLLNGGHDDVRLLARELGLRYAFAPAADAVWGDAILTNLPVVSWHAERMPSYGAPTGGQVMGAVLRHGAGTVAVVSTHLQPPPDGPPLDQARDAARFAAGLRAPDRPVIMGGDLNTQPGDPPFEAILAAGFTDAFAAARPVYTSASDRPRKQIDHVLVSGARAGDVTAPRSTASDHLAVAVTLRW